MDRRNGLIRKKNRTTKFLELPAQCSKTQSQIFAHYEYHFEAVIERSKDTFELNELIFQLIDRKSKGMTQGTRHIC
jgi:hypothetical protein